MQNDSPNLARPAALAERPRPLGELLALALPTVAQMASYTLMQFCDALQLSMGAGDESATAAGMAGFMVFALMSWPFGALLVVNTLVSQAVGRGDIAGCGRYLWQGVWFGLACGLLLLPTIVLAGPVFRAFGHAETLVSLEVRFYTLCLLFIPLRLVSLAFAQFLLAIGRPNTTLLGTVCAAAVAITGNWILINGHFGFPKMGVVGAAIATNCGVLAELLVMVAFALSPGIRATYNSARWRFDAPAMRQLLRLGIPGGVQTVTEVAAWFIFSVWLLNFFGQPAVTANNYMMQYMKVSFMPAFGISAAVTTLVGRYIGMGRPDLARHRADLGFKVTMAYMITCGLAFFLGRNVLIGLFTVDAEVLRIGAALLTVAAVYQFFDGLYIIYLGALRGAGDTFVPAVLTAALCWGVAVGGGYVIAVTLPGLGAVGPWLAASVYGIAIGLILLRRFRRGRWKAIALDDPHASAKLPGFDCRAAPAPQNG